MNVEETQTQGHQEPEGNKAKIDQHSTPEKLVWWMSSEGEYEQGRIIAENEAEAEIAIGEKRLSVKQEYLHKANPSKFDLVDNMSHLSYLNEPSILHNLRQRYLAEMQYTYSGLFLVAINPYKDIPIYTKEYIERYSCVYKREDAPPHIYAVASEAYHLMRNTKTPQTILITGESGAGKTENTKHAIAFLTKVSGDLSHGASVLEERLLSTNPLLEAFGNAQTGRNDNSSRFGKFIKIEFGVNGQIVGALVERYLLESSRVTNQANGERNYHVFYALTKEADESLLESLRLQKNRSYRIVSETNGKNITMESIYSSMEVLGFSEKDKEKIFKILAAVIHLGEIKFTSIGKKVDVENDSAEALDNVAFLLGVESAALKETLLYPKIQAGREIVVHGRSPEEANTTVFSLCKVLYERLFDWIVSLVNTSLKPKEQAQSYIGVLDIAGFEILEKNGFEQLCINYTNEKLQQFFNHRMFILEQDIYMKEGLEWNMIDFGLDLQPTIDLLETAGTGIFSILDEECVVPGGSDARLLDKISKIWGRHKKFSIPKVRGGFSVEHYAGKVKYNENGWILKNKDPLDEDIASLLLGSKGPLPMPSIKSGLAATRFRTVAQGHKEQLAGLLKMLYTTNPHFVRCILSNRQKKSNCFEVPRVLHQLRCNGVLEGVRISRQGFPTRVEFREFVQRYALLSRAGKEQIPSGEKGALALLNELGVPPSLFRLGKTKLFLRQGVLADLEEHRNAKISGLIFELQRRLRVLLSNNIGKLKKERDDSVALLQKNVKIYASVRNWSWWKLCMKVRPLLEVRKAEDDIKDREIKIARQSAEIQELHEKISSLETEYAQALQEAQKSLIQSEKAKTLAEIEKAEAETAAEEIKTELTSAQKASNKYYTQVNEMKQIIETLEIKIEQARKDAASEVTKKLLAELSELKALYAEAVEKNKILQKSSIDAHNKVSVVEQERSLVVQERDAAQEKNKKLSAEIEELQNEVKVTESLRYKGEISLRRNQEEIERLNSLLSFEKEKLQKVNEAFERAAVQERAPVAPIVKDNKEDLIRLQKELDHEKERAAVRQKEYEDLKKEYIDLVDKKLQSIVMERQQIDSEAKKHQQALANQQLKTQKAEEFADELRSRVIAAEKQNAEENQRNQTLLREIAEKKAKEIEVTQELFETKRKASELLEQLEAEKRASESENDKRIKLYNAVVSEIKASVLSVEELRKIVQDLSDNLFASMKVIALYKGEIRTLSEELIRCEEEKAKALQRLGRALSNAKEYEMSLELATSQIQALAQEKEHLLEETETELNEQRDKYEHAETLWQNERKELKSKNRDLEKEIKEKERTNASLIRIQQEKEHLHKQLQETREEIQKAIEEKETLCGNLMKKIQETALQISREKAESEKHRREMQVAKESVLRLENALKDARNKESMKISEIRSLEEIIACMQGREKDLSLEIRKLSLQISASKLVEKSFPNQTLEISK